MKFRPEVRRTSSSMGFQQRNNWNLITAARRLESCEWNMNARRKLRCLHFQEPLSSEEWHNLEDNIDASESKVRKLVFARKKRVQPSDCRCRRISLRTRKDSNPKKFHFRCLTSIAHSSQPDRFAARQVSRAREWESCSASSERRRTSASGRVPI